MMGFFFLLTLYAAARSITAPAGRSTWWSALAVTACAVGMGTKESMVAAPLVVLLYDAVFHTGALGEAVRARRWLYAGLAASWIILAILVAPGPRSHSAGLSSGVTPWTYLLNQPPMIVTYLRLAFWPNALVLDYGPTFPVALGSILPQAVMVAALVLGVAISWRWSPAVGFLGTVLFITLAPSSSIVPIATEVGAERRMYLPLAAVVVMTVFAGRVALQALSIDALRRRRIATTCVVVVCCALSWLTIQRNAEYRTGEGIWRTVLARRPHGRARYQLATILAEQGRKSDAIALYRAALVDCPDAHYGLAFELAAEGNNDEAIDHLREYIRLRPDDLNVIRAHILLGRALIIAGRHTEAAEVLRRALSMRPGDTDAHGLLADAWLALQRYEDAAREYRVRTVTPRRSPNSRTPSASRRTSHEHGITWPTRWRGLDSSTRRYVSTSMHSRSRPATRRFTTCWRPSSRIAATWTRRRFISGARWSSSPGVPRCAPITPSSCAGPSAVDECFWHVRGARACQASVVRRSRKARSVRFSRAAFASPHSATRAAAQRAVNRDRSVFSDKSCRGTRTPTVVVQNHGVTESRPTKITKRTKTRRSRRTERRDR
jgi:hypothetical protein